jgi:Tfp pilus assembly protein PilN
MEQIIEINLLPGKKRRKQLSRENRQIITIGIVFLIILALLYAGLRVQLYQRTSYLNDLNNQIDQLKNVENLLNKRQTLGDELFYYETTIEKLVNSQINWNNLIDELSTSLPKDTVIESLSSDRTKNSIKITGHTLDLQKLAWTFNSLKVNGNFENVVVESYNIPFEKEKTQTAPQYVTFTITFAWKEIKK